MHYVYILRCADRSLYIGHTDNLALRIARHNAGAADCSFTCNRRPVTLVYSEPFPSRAAAVKRERQLKRWTRAKKEALIAGDTPSLRKL
jgi:tRNA/rRNA methyltransferase